MSSIHFLIPVSRIRFGSRVRNYKRSNSNFGTEPKGSGALRVQVICRPAGAEVGPACVTQLQIDWIDWGHIKISAYSRQKCTQANMEEFVVTYLLHCSQSVSSLLPNDGRCLSLCLYAVDIRSQSAGRDRSLRLTLSCPFCISSIDDPGSGRSTHNAPVLVP